MTKLFLAGLALCIHAAGSTFTYYNSQPAFLAALLGAPVQTVTFDSVALGSYAPLTVGGITITGDLNGGVRVFDQATWTLPFFGSSSGNSVAATAAMNIALPSGVYAVGFQLGVTFIAATNCACSSTVQFTPSGGSAQGVAVSSANLFPFFGVISNGPIASIALSSSTFLTIDNLVTASSVPEPQTALLCAIPLAGLLWRRGRKRQRRLHADG